MPKGPRHHIIKAVFPPSICPHRPSVVRVRMVKRSSEGDINVQILQTDSRPTLLVDGRLTVDTSPRLRSALLKLLQRKPGGTIVIDLSKVSYLDISGVATLLEALIQARERSVKLRVVGAGGQVKMLADIAGLNKIFAAAGSEVLLN